MSPDGEANTVWNLGVKTPTVLWKLNCAISKSPFKIGKLVAGFKGFNQKLSKKASDLTIRNESTNVFYTESLILAQNERWRRG